MMTCGKDIILSATKKEIMGTSPTIDEALAIRWGLQMPMDLKMGQIVL